MKKIGVHTGIAALAVFVLLACSSRGKHKTVITERIQYDVTIKSPDPDLDWWNQNLEGPKRDNFVKLILDMGWSGRVKAYDYFNQPLTPAEVKAIGCRTDTILTKSTRPPYNDTLVTVKKELKTKDITRVRFLEEWYFDSGKNLLEKKVVGMAPILENYGDDGELRGYTPLFWLYFDEKYPAVLK